MTIAAAIALSTSILGLISWGLRIYSQVNKAAMSLADRHRLEMLANTAVLAAEEMHGKESGLTKIASAMENIMKAFPELTEPEARVEAHAALRRTIR